MASKSDIALWQEKPLELVIAWIRYQVSRDRTWFTGDIAALLARRLIDAEVTVGGPYRNEDGIVDAGLNRDIEALLVQLGIHQKAGELLSVHTETRPASAKFKLTPPQQAALDIVKTFPAQLRAGTRVWLNRVILVDAKDEISGIATMFADTLEPSSVDATILGTANLFTWLAYTIYDDFYDDEGDSLALPIANAAHCEAIRLFSSQTDDAGFVEKTFLAMDAANAWEMQRARMKVTVSTIEITALPAYESLAVLARRAAGHSLGVLMVANKAKLSERNSKGIASTMHDYLIARQLNDDLHDWIEDLRAGRITPVVAHLFQAANVKLGRHKLDDLVATLQVVFWESGLQDVTDRALTHIARAERRAVQYARMQKSDPFIQAILKPIHQSLVQGIERHEQDKLFLTELKNSNSLKR